MVMPVADTMKLLRKCFAISILAVLLLAASGQLPTYAAEPSLENVRIANIVFEPPAQPLEGSELFALLPVKRGEPYHAADVRTGIERLYATGRYQDIQVDATLSGNDGVLIRFITKGSWFVGGVSAKADFSEPPSANQIVNVARLRSPQRLPTSVNCWSITAISIRASNRNIPTTAATSR